jgi:hypothetical protein
MTLAQGFQSIDDHTILIFHTLYDKNEMKVPMTLTSADDRVVLFFHTLFDKDAMKSPISITSIDDS